MTAPGPQPRHPCQRGNLVLVLTVAATVVTIANERYLIRSLRLKRALGQDSDDAFFVGLRIVGERSEGLPRLINPKPGEVTKSSTKTLIWLEVQAHGSVHESWISHHVRVAEQLPDHDAPIVSHNTVKLRKGLVLHGNLPQHRDEESPVELVVLIRQHPSIADLRNHVSEPLSVCALHRVIEHLGLNVEGLEGSVGLELLGHVDRVVARSRSHLEQAFTRGGSKDLEQLASRDDWPRQREEGAGSVGTGRGVLAPIESRAGKTPDSKADQSRSSSHHDHLLLL
jgi:hypothetical protein